MATTKISCPKTERLTFALNRKVEPHPNPYKIGWIKKGGDSQITEICSVPLFIGGSYKDQIVCDVLDMDVCHILLGRPWQYDIQAYLEDGKTLVGSNG